jgi:hypothetical protein
MSARAVAVTRPAPTMIARLAFLHILSGQRPVARLSGLIRMKVVTGIPPPIFLPVLLALSHHQ